MIRAAVVLVLGAMAATPAAAACQSVPALVDQLRTAWPAGTVVREVTPLVVPAIASWLEAEGLPGGGSRRLIQVYDGAGIRLVPIAGEQVCDTDPVVLLTPMQSVALATLVRRYRELRGWGMEREA